MENTKAQKLFIPKTLHVGFQKRNNTFDGKLAYVIYEDEKGKLRKETSWNSWRDKDIEPLILENKPTKFILNKSIHHYSDWSWSSSSGHHMMRMYDVRGIEIEITPENLVGILMHSNVSMRDFEQEMVYAWDGKELVLLPVNSTDYQASIQFTEDQDVKLSTKDLKVGQIYKRKKEKGELKYVYLGFYEKYDLINPIDISALEDIVYSDEYPFYFENYYYGNPKKRPIYNGEGFVNKGNKHVFLCLDYQKLYQEKYQTISPSVLMPVGEMVMENYQNEIVNFLNSYYHKGYQYFDFIQEKTFINIDNYASHYDYFFKKECYKNPKMRNHYIKLDEKYYVLESVLFEIANINFSNEICSKWNNENDRCFSWKNINHGKIAQNISFKNMKNQNLIHKTYKDLIVFFCNEENKKIESDKIYYKEKDGLSDVLFNQIKESLIELLNKTMIKELVSEDIVKKITDIKMNFVKDYFNDQYVTDTSFNKIKKILSEIEFDVYVLDKDKL